MLYLLMYDAAKIFVHWTNLNGNILIKHKPGVGITDKTEITSNLSEADLKALRKKYNDEIAGLIAAEIMNLPESLRKPVLDETIRCIINSGEDVYSG